MKAQGLCYRLFDALRTMSLEGQDVEKAVRFWVHSHKNVLRSEDNKKNALLRLRELRHDLALIGVSFPVLNEYLGQQHADPFL